MEHGRHVFRVLFVLLLAIAVIMVGRSLLVPKSYGMYGPYRYDNVTEQANVRAPLHGGAASCTDCHAERAKAHAGGSHKVVSCEICHGALGHHVKDGKVVARMGVDQSFTLCARCHRKVLGRPEKFPQVVLSQHVESKLEGRVCLDCHDPHSPKL